MHNTLADVSCQFNTNVCLSRNNTLTVHFHCCCRFLCLEGFLHLSPVRTLPRSSGKSLYMKSVIDHHHWGAGTPELK